MIKKFISGEADDIMRGTYKEPQGIHKVLFLMSGGTFTGDHFIMLYNIQRTYVIA